MAKKSTAGKSSPGTTAAVRMAADKREIHSLLTKLLQQNDAGLIRAVKVNLQSLLKQTRSAAVPWQRRPPGHFEPPDD